MKIGQYCQRQRCKHVESEQCWHAFASRGFVSDSWAFLFIFLCRHVMQNHDSCRWPLSMLCVQLFEFVEHRFHHMSWRWHAFCLAAITSELWLTPVLQSIISKHYNVSQQWTSPAVDDKGKCYDKKSSIGQFHNTSLRMYGHWLWAQWLFNALSDWYVTFQSAWQPLFVLTTLIWLIILSNIEVIIVHLYSRVMLMVYTSKQLSANWWFISCAFQRVVVVHGLVSSWVSACRRNSERQSVHLQPWVQEVYLVSSSCYDYSLRFC